MPGSDPWKNRKAVRICAFIDFIFAVAVITLYVCRLTLEERREDGSIKGFFRLTEKRNVTNFYYFAGFFTNGLQLVVAYSLFAIVAKAVYGPSQIPRVKNWLIVSNAVFVVLIAKFIYFVFFDRASQSAVKFTMFSLVITELLFKALAMYFVKEFLDDLKSVYNPPPAKPQFSISNVVGVVD